MQFHYAENNINALQSFTWGGVNATIPLISLCPILASRLKPVRPLLQERIRPFELADVGHVRHKDHAIQPNMQQAGRRFQSELAWIVKPEVEGHLVRRARR